MNYADNFGFQWNRFDKTQLHPQSSEMFWRLTGWTSEELDGVDILEVGSGAGRFSRVILEETQANLYSFDSSSAVDANQRNNGHIAPARFHLARGDLYAIPFDRKFDKVFCRGVLQHTPSHARLNVWSLLQSPAARSWSISIFVAHGRSFMPNTR